MTPTKTGIEVKPLAGSIGAEITGVDLTREISESEFNQIHQVFLEHLVIFLPQQKELKPKNISGFARHFGALDEDPFVFPFKVPAIEGHPEVYSNIKEADNTGSTSAGSGTLTSLIGQNPIKPRCYMPKTFLTMGATRCLPTSTWRLKHCQKK